MPSLSSGVVACRYAQFLSSRSMLIIDRNSNNALCGICRDWNAHPIHTSPHFMWTRQESARVPHDQLGLLRRGHPVLLTVFHFLILIATWQKKNFLCGCKTPWAPPTLATWTVVFRSLEVFQRAPLPSQDQPLNPEARRRKARSNGDWSWTVAKHLILWNCVALAFMKRTLRWLDM